MLEYRAGMNSTELTPTAQRAVRDMMLSGRPRCNMALQDRKCPETGSGFVGAGEVLLHGNKKVLDMNGRDSCIDL